MFCRAVLKKAKSSSRPIFRRFLASSEFSLESHWKSRLDSPCYKSLGSNTKELFFELDKKYQSERRFAAVDVDLFANADRHADLNQLEEVLHRFRRTPETATTLESTHHGVVRAFLDAGSYDDLGRVISDPLNYGLFPDVYSLILALDKCIEADRIRAAAKIAVHVMHQEVDVNEPVLREMSELAVFNFIKSGLDYVEKVEGEDAKYDDDDEEVKIGVRYKPVEFHDDHFDLQSEPDKLLGKTLVAFSSSEDVRLLGLVMWQKWNNIKDLLDKEGDCNITDQVKDLINVKCKNEEIRERISKVISKDEDVEGRLKEAAKKSLEEHERGIMDKQIRTFANWDAQRESEIERQKRLYVHAHRKAVIEAKQRQMDEEAEKLFFFENFNNYEKEKAEKRRQWLKKLPASGWGKRITLRPR